MSLTRNVRLNITSKKTTHRLLKALLSMYKRPSTINKVFLMKKLFNRWMKESSPVAGHINKFNVIKMQLNAITIIFGDDIKAILLLSLLPKSKNGIVTVEQFDMC